MKKDIIIEEYEYMDYWGNSNNISINRLICKKVNKEDLYSGDIIIKRAEPWAIVHSTNNRTKLHRHKYVKFKHLGYATEMHKYYMDELEDKYLVIRTISYHKPKKKKEAKK